MDFALSDERQMLRDTLARLVRERYDIETRHEYSASEDGFSRARWAQFAELGIVGALVPEAAGGFGGTAEDIVVVMEELGRGLVVEPFLATAILGAGILADAGDAAHGELVARAVAGDLLLAFAHGEPQTRYALAEVHTRAARDGDGWRLTGDKAVVINGDTADRLIVSARVAGATDEAAGLALFLVEAGAAGLSRRGYRTIDGGRAAEIRLDGVAAGAGALVGPAGEAGPLIERAAARAVLALCAEALGAMERCKELTLDYLKTRVQFGVPIGRFQALQHRFVDVCLEIEQARSLVMRAAGAFDGPRREREIALAAAKNLVGRAGRLVAEESIQMHGGIGMTWEYPVGHFAKRLVMIDHQFGDTDHHLERFIALQAEA